MKRQENEAQRARAAFERQLELEQKREPEIWTQIERLRIRREAERRLLTEEAGPVAALPSVTLADELELPDVTQPEVIQGLLPMGGSGVLSAQHKAGKTTLAMNLADSLASGKPFLGRFDVPKLQGRIAFLNYEIDEHMFRRWAREMKMTKPGRIVAAHLRGRTAPFWERGFQEHLTDWLLRWGVEFLIIDPAARAWRGLVDNENDNSKIDAFTAAVDELKLSAAVPSALITHHFGRVQHEEGEERARGATRLEDWADALWYLTKDKGGRRALRATGRDVDVEAIDLDYAEDLRRFRATGQTRGERREHHGALAVVGALDRAGSPLQASALDKELRGVGTKQLRLEARAAAISRGWVSLQSGPSNAKLHGLTDLGRQALKEES